MEYSYTPVEYPYTPVEYPYSPVEYPYTPVEYPYSPVEYHYYPVEYPYSPVEYPYSPAEYPYSPVEHPYYPVEYPYPLPLPQVEDIEKENKTIPTTFGSIKESTVVYHDIFTNNILYLDMAFDLHTLPQALPLPPTCLGRG